jgi:hypothetical protein
VLPGRDHSNSVGQLTDASGTFALRGLSIGEEYRVTATDLRGRFEKETTVVVPAVGQALSIELQPSETAPVALEGVVSDPEGRPLPGIDMTLYLSPLLVRCNCLAWTDRTDELGRFSFGLVTDGEHRVAAVDPLGRYDPKIVMAHPGAYLSIPME